jgi:ketosteroid isomerase-like protein
MSQENVEIVRRGYELYGVGDLEGVARLFADDAELADLGGLGVVGTATVDATGLKGSCSRTPRHWRRSTTTKSRSKSSSTLETLSLRRFGSPAAGGQAR